MVTLERTIATPESAEDGLAAGIDRNKSAVLNNLKYRPINPGAGYDRDMFVQKMSEFGDIREWADALKKNPNDLGAGRDLFELALGDGDLRLARNEAQTLQLAKYVVDDVTESTGRFARNNYKTLADKMNDDAWVSLVAGGNVKLYKTGNENHDKFVSAVNSLGKYKKIDQEKDIDQMRKIAADAVKKDKNLPTWAKKFLGSMIKVDSNFATAIFREEVQATSYAVQNVLYTPDGKPKGNVAKAFFERSIVAAEDKWNEEIREGGDATKGKQNDIWKEIRGSYVALADIVYAIEKPIMESENDDIVDLRKREQERADIGMKN